MPWEVDGGAALALISGSDDSVWVARGRCQEPVDEVGGDKWLIAQQNGYSYDGACTVIQAGECLYTQTQ